MRDYLLHIQGYHNASAPTWADDETTDEEMITTVFVGQLKRDVKRAVGFPSDGSLVSIVGQALDYEWPNFGKSSILWPRGSIRLIMRARINGRYGYLETDPEESRILVRQSFTNLWQYRSFSYWKNDIPRTTVDVQIGTSIFWLDAEVNEDIDLSMVLGNRALQTGIAL